MNHRRPPARRGRVTKALLAITSLLGAGAVSATTAAGSAHAADPAPSDPSDITLRVESARDVGSGAGFVHKGDAISKYQWMIAAESTPADHPELGVGNSTQPKSECLPTRAGQVSVPTFTNTAGQHWADTCEWPSIRYTPGNVAIVAQGSQDDLNEAKALPHLPTGRYLISVTANGYEIDGQHFTVDGSGATETVDVTMQPSPLPLNTVRLRVFNDSAPVDGTYEIGAETGLSGFKASLTDVLGLVSTDYYGNPLCTVYYHWGETGWPLTGKAGYMPAAKDQVVFDLDGAPAVNSTAPNNGKCVSDRNGDIVIPNLGSDRYAASVTPPAGWYQTTTLEGAHDWDIWQQNGETGFDTEQSLGGERVPYVDFGFVHSTSSLPAGPTAHITGTAEKILTYIGGKGGLVTPETGTAGAKDGGPISDGLVALSDLEHNDQVVYMGRTGTDGKFDIANVPDGDYQITVWDFDQDYILWTWNVTVKNGKSVNVGKKFLAGWFTNIRGTVFNDKNGNGKQDAGEVGVPQFTLTLKERDNTLMDQYTNTVTTDDKGRYEIREGYPLGKDLVLEAFNTRYQTTGITTQEDNEPSARTLLGSAVDINVLPIIGIGGRVDWGVQPYVKGTNGGIVGTITYDTTRNELDPADAATEAYQPGIPGIPVHLYAPVKCDSTTTLPDHVVCTEGYERYSFVDADGVTPNDAKNGQMVRGPELQDSYTSETWQLSKNCIARMFNGKPFSDTDQLSLPDGNATGNGENCLEAPLSGFYAQPSDTTPGNFGQTVNGNYGFTSSKLNQYAPSDPRDPKDASGNPIPQYAPLSDYGLEDQPLVAGDFIVSVDVPKDSYGKPLYKATAEEDVNVFNGDGYLPQENFPPTSYEAANIPEPPINQPLPPQPPSQQAGIISPCVGSGHTVHTDPETNAGFADAGGSPFEGQWRQSCEDKLVTVRDSQSVAPNFNLFTQVPLPTHFWGLIINDLAISNDVRQSMYGEAQPLPGVPTGIYDWAGRLVDTVTSDFNGEYEALEPSTSTYNCPLPAGPCPGMYRFVGNDPGQPGHLNANYNPRFRTIATNFQAWPGLYTVTDTAPTQMGVAALAPGATQVGDVDCALDGQTPQVYAVDRPVVTGTTETSVTIKGVGFGAAKGTGTVTATLGSTTTTLATTAWSDRQITVTVPGTLAGGAQRLAITAGNGQSSVNGVTLQVKRGTYNPQVLEVGPGKAYATVQSALDAAAPATSAVVVVWPGAPTAATPNGAYLENVVMHSNVKLQGVGPGGTYSDGTSVPGSVINGANFNPDNQSGTDWLNAVSRVPNHVGPPIVPDGAVVTFLGTPSTTSPTRSFKPAIDGLRITGGTQSDFVTNINEVTGGTTTPYGATGAAVTQGGGVYVHGGGQGLAITDNVIDSNSGSYGGGVRVGTPYDTGLIQNSGIAISYNRITNNGGTNLAGGIGLFKGTDSYSVDHNDICGNFSAEYGGAMSHFGLSGGSGTSASTINHNRVYWNQSYDEGGGIFLGGELVTDPGALSPGTGNVNIDANLVQDNLSNDDGGGIRALMAETGNLAMTNNIVVNNVSAHEGGGVALDDAPFVSLVNNTVMKNITTATAMTSDGTPAPAGLSTTGNSDELQAYLQAHPSTANTAAYTKGFSDPVLRNDVFADNRAGRWSGTTASVVGIGLSGDTTAINYWDMGAWDKAGSLSPTYTLYQQGTGNDAAGKPASVNASTTNKVGPLPDSSPSWASRIVRQTYDTTVIMDTSRTTPSFRQAVMVAHVVPPRLMGDYHLSGTGSPAYGAGTGQQTNARGQVTVPAAPSPDYDGQARPVKGRVDAGADQLLP